MLCLLSRQLLHINSTNEAYMTTRPSSLFWCHNRTSFSCLEISSVTLTPMSSPDSTLSAGLLTPPPAKPSLPKPSSGSSLPRPRVKPLSFPVSASHLLHCGVCVCVCGVCVCVCVCVVCTYVSGNGLPQLTVMLMSVYRASALSRDGRLMCLLS